jgi:hypothetical protein
VLIAVPPPAAGTTQDLWITDISWTRPETWCAWRASALRPSGACMRCGRSMGSTIRSGRGLQRPVRVPVLRHRLNDLH